MNFSPKKSFPWVFGFYLILFMFTTFVLLFQFVIPHGGFYVEPPIITTSTITTTLTTSATTGTQTGITTSSTTTTTNGLTYPGAIPLVLETGTLIGSYETNDKLINVYHIRASNSDVYVADVVVKDAYNILAGLAFNTFGGTNVVQAVSTMAEEHNAIFAINSDYASHYSYGYVIRNGMVLRSSASYRDAITLFENGTVVSFAEEETSLQDVVDDGAWQLWSFGPVIIKDGVSVASVNDGLERSAVDNPRSAFGYIGPNHFMFVTVDGRSDESIGVDIEELADIMSSLGCTQAYNFDGGGSATMWFDGEVINHPSEGDERKVGDCVYIQR